jgi:hypothetical protein
MEIDGRIIESLLTRKAKAIASLNSDDIWMFQTCTGGSTDFKAWISCCWRWLGMTTLLGTKGRCDWVKG